MLVQPFIHVVFNALADIQILKQRQPFFVIVVYDLISLAWSNKVIKINTSCDNLRFIRRKQKYFQLEILRWMQEYSRFQDKNFKPWPFSFAAFMKHWYFRPQNSVLERTHFTSLFLTQILKKIDWDFPFFEICVHHEYLAFIGMFLLL